MNNNIPTTEDEELDQQRDINCAQQSLNNSPAQQADGSDLRCEDPKAEPKKSEHTKAIFTLNARMAEYDKKRQESLRLCNEAVRAYYTTNNFYVLAEAARHYMEMHAHAMNFVDTASKLINYQSPKLTQIDVNRAITKRYVIRAPQVIQDVSVWLAKIEYDKRKLKYNERDAKISTSDLFGDNKVEDAEVISVKRINEPKSKAVSLVDRNA